jgi:hypothetical protein
MRERVPSRAPGQSSSELEGVEGTLLTLENQASEFRLTTEITTMGDYRTLIFLLYNKNQPY